MNLMLAGILAATCMSASITLRLGEEDVVVYEGDQTVLVYRYRNVPKKPYVMEWHTPSGRNILRDAPEDHLHHHGLMFAITVDDVNFWEESADGGVQAHYGFTEMRAAPADDGRLAVIGESLGWYTPGATSPLVLEARRVSPMRFSDPEARLLSWQSRLRCPEERDGVTLAGRIYHGLGMRFPAFFDRDGVFRWAEDMHGAFEEGAHTMAHASWCAIAVEHEAETITVAMFDHPENPRPVLWFTMREPFAYLSATLDLSREPMTLAADASTTLRYGVVVWERDATDADIEAAYHNWLQLESE